MRPASALLCLACLAFLLGCRLPANCPERAFYPVGIYAVGDTNDFDHVRCAGFNVVAGKAERPYLDAAAATGLKVLAIPGTPAGPRFEAARARATVRSLDSHPALWAWYLVDEPDLNDVPPEQVGAAQRCVKAAGARKPTALVLFQGYEAFHYAGLADIMMIDRYPVPWLPLANFGQHITMGRLAVGRGKPLIAVVQAFDWNTCPELLPGETNLRPPTHAELRCMTYEALARGANGLFYYAYDAGRWRMREQPQTWQALQSVVQEVNRRLPLFRAGQLWWARRHQFGDREHRFNAALESSVTSTLLRVDAGNDVVPAGDYIVAVNNTDREQQYSFSLPESRVPNGRESRNRQVRPRFLEANQAGQTPAVAVLEEGRSVTVQEGRVTDTFAAYAVHVYGPVASGDAPRTR